MKNLLSTQDLSTDEILQLLTKAGEIAARPQAYATAAQGKILALLFFEPSTRTYFSFQSAMYRLGGQVLGFADTGSTSIAKGETLEDTARIMSAYADILAVRHAQSGSLKRIAAVMNKPLINAGEGGDEHPTQALTDLFTIHQQFKRLDITIGLYGDLKHGRVNHSLLLAAARFGATCICIAPKSLQMPESYLQQAQQLGGKIILVNDIKECAEKLDVLYVTRLQKERIAEAPLNFPAIPIVNKTLLEAIPQSTLILHPLPRTIELDAEIDQDPRAHYFQQAANAVFVRMAILLNYLS